MRGGQARLPSPWAGLVPWATRGTGRGSEAVRHNGVGLLTQPQRPCHVGRGRVGFRVCNGGAFALKGIFRGSRQGCARCENTAAFLSRKEDSCSLRPSHPRHSQVPPGIPRGPSYSQGPRPTWSAAAAVVWVEHHCCESLSWTGRHRDTWLRRWRATPCQPVSLLPPEAPGPQPVDAIVGVQHRSRENPNPSSALKSRSEVPPQMG